MITPQRTGQGARVLVTGAAGMIGANLVHRLVAEGYRVSVLLRPQTDRLRLALVQHALDVHEADLVDADAVQVTVAEVKPDIVFHLASTIWARGPAASPTLHLQVNALSTQLLLEALRQCPGTRIVFTGSSAVYGPGRRVSEARALAPNTIYGVSKAAASLLLQTYARLHGMSTVELRLFMPYGPWEHADRLIPQTILSALAGREIPMTTGTQQRDLVYMDDVVEALLLAATRPVPTGSVFNIGSGTAVTVRELVERVLALMGHPVKPLVGALPTRPDEIMEMSADITAARTQLGWTPRVPLEEGLRRCIEWWTGYTAHSRQHTAHR